MRFYPTTIVTSQVFAKIMEMGLKYEVFYGLYGTGKTFSFILYCELSKKVARAAYLFDL